MFYGGFFIKRGNKMNYYQIGKIVNTHGIKGEVRVQSITDFPEKRFAPGAPVFVFQTGHDPRQLVIKTHRRHKQFDLISFKGLDDINAVETLKGSDLKVSEDQQEELASGEYYYRDIVGLNVLDLDKQFIGTVKEIMKSGANDVWVIERKGQSDLLIPAIKDVVKNVDLDNHQIIIEMLDGLDD